MHSSPTTGIAILGSAHMHAHSVPQYVAKLPAVHIEQVWDAMPSRAAKLADLCQAPIAPSVGEVLGNDRVKAVMIFSETSQHDELIDAALDAGKHVFVDKPLALTPARAWALASRIAGKGVVFSTGFVLRRRPHHLLVRELIGRGAFGSITRIRHANGHNGVIRELFDTPETRWFTQPEYSGGGGFLDEGVHSTDTLLWLMGQRPVRVTAVTGNVTGRHRQCEEFGQGVMVFENGAIGSVSGSWVDPAKTVTLEVCGTRGCAVVLADKELYLTTPDLPGADGKTPWKDLPRSLAHPQEMFLQALVDGNTQHLVSPQDAAAATAVMLTMMQAAANHQWLDVPYHTPITEMVSS